MIRLFIGPMWAGKTTALIQRVNELRADNVPTIVLKPTLDDRYAKREVVSHDGLRVSAALIHDEDHFTSIIDTFGGLVGAIAIDEVQFLPIGSAKLLGDLKDIEVIGAGLDFDCFGQPFLPTTVLMRRAAELTTFSAKCHECSGDAWMTQRFDANGPVTSGDVVQVGGEEMYRPACRNCWKGPNVV